MKKNTIRYVAGSLLCIIGVILLLCEPTGEPDTAMWLLLTFTVKATGAVMIYKGYNIIPEEYYNEPNED